MDDKGWPACGCADISRLLHKAIPLLPPRGRLVCVCHTHLQAGASKQGIILLLRPFVAVACSMGTVLGKISVETQRYVVLAKGEDYEIRECESHLVAEVSYDPAEMKSGKDGGFMILANYIGAVGKPNNVKAEHAVGAKDGEGEKIAMTAPVITQESVKPGVAEKIAMTAPVITHEQNKVVTMQFVLPSKYSADSVPQPTDPRVSVKQIPTKRYGVIAFSGVADDVLVDKKLGRLRNALQQAGYNIAGDHVLARYNPPWTLPFLRTNEIMLPVE